VTPRATNPAPKKSSRAWLFIPVLLILLVGGVAYADPSLVGLGSDSSKPGSSSSDGFSEPSSAKVEGYVGEWHVYNHVLTIRGDGAARFNWAGRCKASNYSDPDMSHPCKAVVPVSLRSGSDGSIIGIWGKATVTFLEDKTLILSPESSYYEREGRAFSMKLAPGRTEKIDIDPYEGDGLQGDDSLGSFMCNSWKLASTRDCK
jgi:hypothetical protein